MPWASRGYRPRCGSARGPTASSTSTIALALSAVQSATYDGVPGENANAFGDNGLITPPGYNIYLTGSLELGSTAPAAYFIFGGVTYVQVAP